MRLSWRVEAWQLPPVLLLVWLLGSPSVGHGYFLDLGVGVRPMAMGGAYVALADDATASLWNPAGLSRLDRRELYTSYASLYTHLGAQVFDAREDRFGYHFVGYAQPFSRTGVAVGWLMLDTLLYDEHTFVWSQAWAVESFLDLGVSVKLLQARLAQTPYIALDPDLAYASLTQTGATLDLGVLLQPSEQVRLGWHATNLRPVRMHWLDEEALPVAITVGLAHLGRWGVQGFDVVWEEGRSLDIRWGGEIRLLQGRLAVRAGTDFRGLTTGFGLRHDWQSVELQLDYALLYPIASIEGSWGSHRIALALRF